LAPLLFSLIFFAVPKTYTKLLSAPPPKKKKLAKLLTDTPYFSLFSRLSCHFQCTCGANFLPPQGCPPGMCSQWSWSYCIKPPKTNRLNLCISRYFTTCATKDPRCLYNPPEV